jgi:hypothetical protein
MHYHCEIVMPPTDDVEAAVKAVLAPFCEHDEDCDHAFWDWYVIGGRSAGSKQMAKCDPAEITAFEEWMKCEGVTVSGLVCGKETLQPKSQIPKVDAKWNEMFPREDGKAVACPLFSHSNDQYGRKGRGTIEGDICTLAEAGQARCGRVLLAGPSFESETEKCTGPVAATFMLCEDQWNGVNHMPIAWDGTLADALSQFKKKCEGMNEDYRKRVVPQGDWLVVTVDYHT